MPVGRTVFAILLLAMATGQGASWPEFIAAVRSYSIGGEVGAQLTAISLLVGELAAGTGLLLPWPRLRMLAGWIGLPVAAIWAGLAVQALGRGLQIENCGCFGRFFAQRLNWWILVQDVYFVGLGLLALRSARRDSRTGVELDSTGLGKSGRSA
ncbi:hypothetical protein BH23ACT12_BH23ACT12_03310 [soil metagenome]